MFTTFTNSHSHLNPFFFLCWVEGKVSHQFHWWGGFDGFFLTYVIAAILLMFTCGTAKRYIFKRIYCLLNPCLVHSPTWQSQLLYLLFSSFLLLASMLLLSQSQSSCEYFKRYCLERLTSLLRVIFSITLAFSSGLYAESPSWHEPQ